MSTPPDPTLVDSLPDPASLLDHPDVAVETTDESVGTEDFAAAEAWTDHVAVGVADDRGVLCHDDGHHGWTLPAFEVTDDTDDLLALARRAFEALTGVPITVDGVEHARRRTFTVAADGDDRETSVWNVILRATPAATLADDPESPAADAALAWRDSAPEDAPDPVAADIERIADPTPAEPSTMTDSTTTTDPTESLSDPETLRDRDGVDFEDVEDDSHFEMNRDHAGVAALAVTNDDGALALAAFDHGPMLPWFPVDLGGDFADGVHTAADALLGIDVDLDDVVRVRRKVSTSDDGERAVAYDVLYAASPADDGTLPAEVPNCEAETANWYASVPDDLTDGNMRRDAELVLE